MPGHGAKGCGTFEYHFFKKENSTELFDKLYLCKKLYLYLITSSFFMKKFNFLTLVTLLFIWTACKNVDQQLVTSMETECNNIEATVSKVNNLNSLLKDPAQLANAVPIAVRENKDSGFAEWFDRYSGLAKKIAAVNASSIDGEKKLRQTIADYKEGKIKTEDVKKEFEISKQLTAGANELVAVLPNLISQMEADYTKFLGGKPMPEMAKSATTSRPEDNPAAIGTPDRQK